MVSTYIVVDFLQKYKSYFPPQPDETSISPALMLEFCLYSGEVRTFSGDKLTVFSSRSTGLLPLLDYNRDKLRGPPQRRKQA